MKNKNLFIGFVNNGYMEMLKEILNTFHGKKILVIGDIILDKYVYGSVNRVSPEAPIPVLNVEKEFYKPGGAANVALNVKNLSPNGEVYIFGFVGNDIYGEELKKLLEGNINCYFEKSGSTIIKERVIGRSSGQKQHIVRIDREEIFPKNFESLDNILQKAEIADKIIVSDYAKGSITQNLMNSLSPYNKKIIIDPKPTNKDFKTLYKNAFLMTPSRDEALRMSKCDNIDDAGYSLRKDFNSNILITLGKDGMKLFPVNNSNFTDIKTTSEESFDETGAGDTAIAIIALALYDNSISSIVNAAKLGNYAAGITIRNIGTYAPSFKELEEKILSLK